MRLWSVPWRFVRLIILLGVVSPVLIYTAIYLSWRSVRVDVNAQNAPSPLRDEKSSAAPLTNARLQPVVNISTRTLKDEPPTAGYSSRVHAFYYPWYAAPAVEGKYLHWNHRILPFWGDKQAVQRPTEYHHPPDDIGAQFYPKFGPYSSRSLPVIDAHMRQMREAGIGVAVVSWYPPKLADENGKPSDDILPLLLDAGQKHGVDVAFHLEPYEPRTAADVRRDIHYIVDTYGRHPAFHRTRLTGGAAPARPVIYAYDSYKISTGQWRSLLAHDGEISIRGGKYDCLMVGLVVNKNDLHTLHDSGFDGSYTYFASRSFTFGSNPTNWKWLNELSAKLGMLFIPSVGPGYDDTAIRPWNADTRQLRAGGKYYRDMIAAALELDVEAISITSFNEWGEGTQIEPAVPYSHAAGSTMRTYLDYQPLQPDGYLILTKQELKNFVPARLV